MNNSPKLKVYDWMTVQTGAVVKRSRHWMREHFDKNSKQLGILVDKEVYPDAVGNIIIWPVIQWEGGLTSSITHPVNAVPYRKAVYNKNNYRDMVE